MSNNVALGLYTYAEFGITALAFLPAMGVVWHLHRDDPTQRQPGRMMRRFGRTTTNLTSIWRFSVEGTPPADIDHRGYVVVANHESTADPFLLSFLPFDMRWIAKEEIFKLPVIGRLMRYGGDICLRRGDRSSVVEMMAECRRTLAAGMNVMIFPEGTRSPDGNLLPFKDGAFDLAISTGAPILPIALSGTHACRPKGSKWFGKATAIARVLDPIPTAGLTAEDLPGLRERTRATIAAAVADLRPRTSQREAPAHPTTPPAPSQSLEAPASPPL